jgi:hypothetical protein
MTTSILTQSENYIQTFTLSPVAALPNHFELLIQSQLLSAKDPSALKVQHRVIVTDVALRALQQAIEERLRLTPSTTINGGFLFPESTLAPALILAFQATNYNVDATPPFVLKIGEASAALAQLLKQSHVDCAAYVTTCNPLSQQLDEAVNAGRQAELEQELNRRSLPFIRGVGLDSQGEWPGEASFLILGLSLEASRALGDKYMQNAIVWSDQDAVPQLILLK